MANCETITYSPVYSDVLGIYLRDEAERVIRELTLVDSKLTVHYSDGEDIALESDVMFIMIDDRRFRRRTNVSLSGFLFKYDIEDAMLYNLDMTKALDYKVMNLGVRKKIK